jgi:hypothetical protein
MRASILALVLLLGGAASAEAPSSPLPTGPWLPGVETERLASARPGSWVEYRLLLDGKPVGWHLRYVCAGADTDGLWLELWISSRPGSGTMGFQLRLDRRADGRLELARVRQRLLGGKVVEVPLRPEDRKDGDLLSSSAGEVSETWTTVMTEAGTFRARRVELREEGKVAGRIWLVDSLPLFGIARMEFPGGVGWEILSHGDESRLLFGAPDPEPAARGDVPP